ncbi:hypothetical protein B0H11DRAFT_2281754 [Mycena galericulata]|nr:hypothetical protein B0H11DRAFT_2281754 [Mycena galericulata]
MPDSQPSPEPEGQPTDTGTTQYAGAFFPRSERLLISGGVFTSNVTHITQGTPPLPPGTQYFRMVPMGDIYLSHGVGVVTHSTGRKCVPRRVYSARIEGKQNVMTVAMYQGNNAEQEWQEDLSRYLWLRSRGNQVRDKEINRLLLGKAFVDLMENSPFLIIHMIARWLVEKYAQDYFVSVFHGEWEDLDPYWSFDPTGAEHLSTEAASHQGFPPFEFRTLVKLKSWDDSVYAGLREFHESRGFDPDSQDMARDLGHLIYKLPDGASSTADDEDLRYSPIQDLHENSVQGLQSEHLATPFSPEDFIPLSRASKFVIAVKLALILFVVVSSVYNEVRGQVH